MDLHSASSLLRNRSASRRPTVTLVRNDLLTDLLPAADPEHLTVQVDPTGSPVPRAGDFAKIDNLRHGTSASTKRGLSAFPSSCGSPLSAEDLHVFRVLGTLVRGLYYNEGGSSSDFPKYRQRALIYRGAAAVAIPGGTRVSYRIDVYDDEFGDGGNPPDRFSSEIDIDLGADGALGAAVLRRLPLCASVGQRDCSSNANGGRRSRGARASVSCERRSWLEKAKPWSASGKGSSKRARRSSSRSKGRRTKCLSPTCGAAATRRRTYWW